MRALRLLLALSVGMAALAAQPRKTLVLPTPNLSTDAGWYGGVARVITPVDHWFKLPMPVREAIFRSGVRVDFIGEPSPDQKMTEIDRALLRIASSRVNEADPPRTRRYDAPVQRRPRAAEIVREMRPLLIAVLMLPLPIVGWMAMRRRPRWTVIAVIIVATVALITARDSILAKPHEFRSTMLRMVAPGVYETISRKGKTRSLGTPATIRSRPAENDTLVVEYETNMPVDYVKASWICGNQRCAGTAHANGQTRGRVTVRNGVESWSCLACLLDDPGDAQYVDLIHMTSERATAVRGEVKP